MKNFLSNDLAMDLGTVNTLVYIKNEGIVLNEPSVVAINRNDGSIIAVGGEAKKMLGRTPAYIIALQPLAHGVIADFEIAQTMIRYFIKKAQNHWHFFRPRIVIGVPSGITEVERRAVKEAGERAGARQVFLIEEPLAAAIGANMPVEEAGANMIVDIGGGTTEVAVISLGGIVLKKSLRVAGNDLDSAIIDYFKKKYNLQIGERTAEELKIKTAQAIAPPEGEIIEIKGRDFIYGLPKIIKIDVQELTYAIDRPLKAIIEVIKEALEETPPELSVDLLERGIVLAGGGALLKKLSDLIQEEINLPVLVADNPLTTVVLGCAKYLEILSNFPKSRIVNNVGESKKN